MTPDSEETMLPVTPTTYNYAFPAPGDAVHKLVQVDRSGNRQKKPYNLLLPYDSLSQFVTRYTPGANLNWVSPNSTNNPDTHAWRLWSPDLQSHLTAATNLAIKRHNAKRGQTASWSVTLAERKQAMGMLTNRVIQMTRFVRHMNRFEFGDAFNAVLSKHDTDGWERYHRYKSEGRFRKGARWTANNILEGLFGWYPTVSDISSTVEILSSPIPKERVSASATSRWGFVSGSVGSGSGPQLIRKGFCKVKVGGNVVIDNPNLLLANQLGLVNPALLFYEITKFSFLFNYFVNLEEYLNSFTDSVGWSHSDHYYTQSVSDNVDVDWVYPLPNGTHLSAKSFHVKRTVNKHPSVTLAVRPPWELSAKRGAVLASLLVQQMPQAPRDLRARRLVTASERKRARRALDHFSLTGEAFR